ncbi:ECF-type sigma factor [Terriglobus roseus]|uniref:RNA polymerase sigma factor, TIGR02999 family n=1 Tax=Terriglobus roseus TaxID=392734 RepID=A0A1G7KPD3_9BACT|nr:ECF-type sigma factor [Terriglobus roseus]SDF38629.1 RNA polymerase sigma factor, TIGR02999 family [Terriglobus roseus]
MRDPETKPFTVSAENLEEGSTSQSEGHAAMGRRELDDLFSELYEKLWRVASSIRRRDPGATQRTGTLVHEAWLKLKDSGGLAALPQPEFIALAAHAMRQVLVDGARKRHALKRGGSGEIIFTELDDLSGRTYPRSVQLLDLDRALTKLQQWNPRQATVVECRYFLGMSVPEAATSLNLSESSIERDWRVAKAWLSLAVGGSSSAELDG